MANVAVGVRGRGWVAAAGVLGCGGAVLAVWVWAVAALGRAEIGGAGTQLDLVTASAVFADRAGILPGVAGVLLASGLGLLGYQVRGIASAGEAVRRSRWWTLWQLLAVGVVVAAGFAVWGWGAPWVAGPDGPHILTPFYDLVAPAQPGQADAAVREVARRATPWDQMPVAFVVGAFAVVHARVTLLVLRHRVSAGGPQA